MADGNPQDYSGGRRPRCRAYVDYANLRYLMERTGADRWLDLRTYLQRLAPSFSLEDVHVFYASANPVQISSMRDRARALYEEAMLKALFASDPQVIGHQGRLQYTSVSGTTQPHGQTLGRVHRYVEKGVDVQLSVQLVEDIFTSNHDAIMLVSNDGDLAPALASAQRRGIVTILAPPAFTEVDLDHPGRSGMRVSYSLAQHADLVVKMDARKMAMSLLPDVVVTAHDEVLNKAEIEERCFTALRHAHAATAAADTPVATTDVLASSEVRVPEPVSPEGVNLH